MSLADIAAGITVGFIFQGIWFVMLSVRLDRIEKLLKAQGKEK